MSLLPDDASFHERIQALFAYYRGHGVALSAKDVELLEQWAAAQVPFEVVARGVRLAAERAAWDAARGESTLRSLRACRKAVDAEIAKFRRSSVGRPETDGVSSEDELLATRWRKLRAAVAQLEATAPALARVRLDCPTSFEAADRQEHLVEAVLIRSLDRERRRELFRLTRSMTTSTSRDARKLELRFHRTREVRRLFGLNPFW